MDCPTWVGDAAIGMVETAYDKYSGFATQSFLNAQQAMVQLGNISMTPISFGVAFNVPATLTGYYRPVAPDLPVIEPQDIDGVRPAPDVSVSDASFDEAPVFNAPIPVLVFPAPPAETMPAEPGGPPVLAPLTVPTAPVLEYPDVPTLLQLDLPEPPDISIPEFAGVRPTASIPMPLNNFALEPTQYSSALLDDVGDTISAMLAGELLPGSVAAALRARAYASLDIEESRAVQTAVEEFAGRGFTEPNGILAKRLSRVRKDAADRRAGLNRDIYIQDQTAAIESRRLAVGQAVALEGMLLQGHHEFMRISLAIEQAQVQIGIDIANLHVAVFTAEMQAYQIDAAVFKTLVEAELAELELYKAQLDGQRLRGEINLQQVQIYEQRIRALLARVEIYKAENDAVRTQAQVQETQIEGYKSTVQAYAERVRARTAVFDGYRARVEAEGAKASAAQAVASIYQSRVQGWSVTQQSKAEQQRVRLGQRDLELRAWTADIERYRADVDAEQRRIASLVQVFGAQVDRYRTDGLIEQMASESNARQFQLLLERARAQVDSQLKAAEIAINQLVQLVAQQIEAQRGIAQTASQLAGSAMSAVNFSAGVSSARNQSQGCSVSTSYSGEI
jgi:hypothetical protein